MAALLSSYGWYCQVQCFSINVVVFTELPTVLRSDMFDEVVVCFFWGGEGGQCGIVAVNVVRKQLQRAGKGWSS
jgi:hypothetical protein